MSGSYVCPERMADMNFPKNNILFSQPQPQ